ncbi:MAG: phosphonate C-P lyase system protein PhnG [Oculatellaceae cyanobacterium Prado106]|jgi:alpha-D-ribose 1-methylphosphonate 5-triphosphate synthase subunit PhnG|nr:phosphonate C-P lyase system protein PhnG [Oculatellaceae cyanobacterium Prado106]
MTSIKPRQLWMATLAKASLEALESRVAMLGELPPYRFLRPPEIGLVMVQGRMDGSGEPFCVGEMTLTRCVVKLEADLDTGLDVDEGGGAIAGFGYVSGRSHRHAELAAICDALLQHPVWYDPVQETVVEFLQTLAQQQKEIQQRQVEATKVNFFTLDRKQ